MYENYITSGNKWFCYDDLKIFYKSRISFHASINYLMNAGIIAKERMRSNASYYALSLSGELLARILCSLPDLPERYKNLKWTLRL